MKSNKDYIFLNPRNSGSPGGPSSNLSIPLYSSLIFSYPVKIILLRVYLYLQDNVPAFKAIPNAFLSFIALDYNFDRPGQASVLGGSSVYDTEIRIGGNPQSMNLELKNPGIIIDTNQISQVNVTMFASFLATDNYIINGNLVFQRI